MPMCAPTAATARKAVSEEVREVLAQAEVNGVRVTLPQMDRKLYVAVNKVLDALGGTWNSRAKAHVFESDPTEALAAVVDGGEDTVVALPARTAEGFVPTPPHVATDMVRNYCDLMDLGAGWRVLEPSAGDGALVSAILEVQSDCTIVAVEPNVERAAKIGDDPRVTLVAGRIEDYADDVIADDGQLFDLVVMNPPYSLPDDPTPWAKHVQYAWSLLKTGGQLVAILPGSIEWRQGRVFDELRNWLELNDGNVQPLGFDAFPTFKTAIVYATKQNRP
jgi:phospholipid N-methyltransferase